MLEMKITITAADLTAAINNLAVALANSGIARTGVDNSPTFGSQPATERIDATAAPKQTGAPSMSPERIIAASIPNAAPVPNTVVDPTKQVPGAPLSAAPTRVATPAVPVAASIPNAAQAPAVPTAAPQYTLEMLATAGSALIDAGKMDQLTQLLSKFGVASLTGLAPASYGAVASELRSLGAAI